MIFSLLTIGSYLMLSLPWCLFLPIILLVYGTNYLPRQRKWKFLQQSPCIFYGQSKFSTHSFSIVDAFQQFYYRFVCYFNVKTMWTHGFSFAFCKRTAFKLISFLPTINNSQSLTALLLEQPRNVITIANCFRLSMVK